MRRLISIACALTLPALAACGGSENSDLDSQDQDLRALKLGDFTFVTAVIALDDGALALQEVLRANKAPVIANGRTTLAGLTQRELEGGKHDPSAKTDSAFGIACGEDGIGIVSCNVTGVARVADVVTRQSNGITQPTMVTLRGKLAKAVAASLPPIGAQTTGGRTVGYTPLGIKCTSTSGHDANGAVVACAIPTAGLGASINFADAVKPGTEGMTKKDAEKLIRTFFPNG